MDAGGQEATYTNCVKLGRYEEARAGGLHGTCYLTCYLSHSASDDRDVSLCVSLLQFFQGPSPKTGKQENLPSFFSSENFDGVSANPQLLLFGGVLVAGVTALGAFLVVA